MRETLKKSSFPRRWESRLLILLGFAFGKNNLPESICVSLVGVVVAACNDVNPPVFERVDQAVGVINTTRPKPCHGPL